ncbi:MAG: hydrogenase maturation protease [Methanomassiliicoccus sp.]|nr:hydrogenase maturation protease [Methanomassiliicoccus sp.]
MRNRTLVLGIGSPIMCDDAIGLRVLQELKNRGTPDVDLEEACVSGLDLIEIMLDYELVIVVDAIIKSGHPAGTIMVLSPEDFSDTVHGTNPHEANVATTLALGRTLEPDRFPKKILFVAVEANDVFTVSEEMTPEVEAALGCTVDKVLELIAQN